MHTVLPLHKLWCLGGGGDGAGSKINAGRGDLRSQQTHAGILELTSPTDSTHLSKGNGEVLSGPLNLSMMAHTP